MGIFRPNIQKLYESGDLAKLSEVAIKSNLRGDTNTSIRAVRAIGLLRDRQGIDVIMTLLGHYDASSTKSRALVAKEALIVFGDIGRYTAARRILLRMTSMSKSIYFEELRAGFVQGFERMFKHASEDQKTAMVNYLEKLLKQDFYPSYGSTSFIHDLIDDTVFSFADQRSIGYFTRRMESATEFYKEKYIEKLNILRTLVTSMGG